MKVKKQNLIVTLILMIVLGTGSCFASTNDMITTNEAKRQDTISQTITIEESRVKDYFKDLDNIVDVNGKKYSKESMEKIKEDESNKKEISKEIKSEELLNSTNEEKAKELFSDTLNYEESGFKGTLKLEKINFETISQGYYEQIEYLDLDFSGYNQNELATIEKEITNNKKNWVLINVDWTIEETREVDGTQVPVTYKGTKHYQRVGTYQNPNKYKAIAVYSGVVETDNPKYEYEISYKLIQEPKEETKIEEQEQKSYVIPGLIIGAIGILVIIFVLYKKNKNTK